MQVIQPDKVDHTPKADSEPSAQDSGMNALVVNRPALNGDELATVVLAEHAQIAPEPFAGTSDTGGPVGSRSLSATELASEMAGIIGTQNETRLNNLAQTAKHFEPTRLDTKVQNPESKDAAVDPAETKPEGPNPGISGLAGAKLYQPAEPEAGAHAAINADADQAPLGSKQREQDLTKKALLVEGPDASHDSRYEQDVIESKARLAKGIYSTEKDFNLERLLAKADQQFGVAA